VSCINDTQNFADQKIRVALDLHLLSVLSRFSQKLVMIDGTCVVEHRPPVDRHFLVFGLEPYRHEPVSSLSSPAVAQASGERFLFDVDM